METSCDNDSEAWKAGYRQGWMNAYLAARAGRLGIDDLNGERDVPPSTN